MQSSSNESFKEVIAYMWSRNRTDFVRSILNLLFRERPIFVFFTVLAIKFLSWYNILPVILLAFFVNHFLNEILGLLSIISRRFKVINGFIEVYNKVTNFKLKKQILSDYLFSEQYEDINTWFVKKWLILFGVKNVSLNDLVKLYELQLDNTGKIPENPTCYHLALFDSYIFLDFSPKENDHFQRFCLLHELGHASLSASGFNFFAKNGFKIHLIFLILLYLFFDLEFSSIYPWILIVTIIIIGRIEQIKDNRKQKLNDEIQADEFAISYLDDESIKFINEYKHILESLQDKNISESQNKERIKIISKLLEYKLTNNEDEMTKILDKSMTKPSFFLIFLNGLAFSLPAIFSQNYNKNLVMILFIMAIVLLIVWIFLTIWQLLSKDWIDNELSKYTTG